MTIQQSELEFQNPLWILQASTLMSENTPPDTLPTEPYIPAPPSQSQPIPPHSRPTAGHHTSHPYPPHPHNYSQPPARSFGCGRAALYGCFVLVILGFIGVATLIGSVFLFAIANDAVAEISAGIDMQEKAVTEKLIGGNPKTNNKVAVITINGVITSNADGFIAKQIRRAASDTNIKAVVLRVDSPGGTMTGSDYYLYLLKKMKSERKIPIIVSMGSIAASGGYYVSMVGDEIYAEPSTITGSIGVIVALFDASELFKKIGVESTPITSGQHKAMGSFMKPMSEEERGIWQHLIDDNFKRFKQIIREGRDTFADSPEELDKLATGQIYTANEAVAHQLIDKIGFMDDAIERAVRLARLEQHDYKVIQYKPKLSFMEFLESRAPNKLLSGETLSKITTPKVYLLCPHVIPVDE